MFGKLFLTLLRVHIRHTVAMGKATLKALHPNDGKNKVEEKRHDEHVADGLHGNNLGGAADETAYRYK